MFHKNSFKSKKITDTLQACQYRLSALVLFINETQLLESDYLQLMEVDAEQLLAFNSTIFIEKRMVGFGGFGEIDC